MLMLMNAWMMLVLMKCKCQMQCSTLGCYKRIVDDHKNYMVRAKPKCKIDGETSGHWSASAWEALRTPTWISERGGLQGMDRDITTCHLPLNYGAPSYLKVPVYPSTTPVYKETTHITLGLRPNGSTSIGHGQTQRNDELSPQPSSTSTHTSHING